MRQVGGCGAPLADIGTCRTATIDTKRRKEFPVRLFGGGGRREGQRGTWAGQASSAMRKMAGERWQ